MEYLSRDRKIPPFFIIHSSKDRFVPFGQSVMLYNALRSLEKTVEFYKLRGVDHVGIAYWQKDILDLVEAFIKRQIV
jgi:dipeptidyl aminopeptidase/acylaminoacyl peptidase